MWLDRFNLPRVRACASIVASRLWAARPLPQVPYDAPAAGTCEAFQTIMREEFGVNTTVRKTMGQVRSALADCLVLSRLRMAVTGASLRISGVSWSDAWTEACYFVGFVSPRRCRTLQGLAGSSSSSASSRRGRGFGTLRTADEATEEERRNGGGGGGGGGDLLT